MAVGSSNTADFWHQWIEWEIIRTSNWCRLEWENWNRGEKLEYCLFGWVMGEPIVCGILVIVLILWLVRKKMNKQALQTAKSQWFFDCNVQCSQMLPFFTFYPSIRNFAMHSSVLLLLVRRQKGQFHNEERKYVHIVLIFGRVFVFMPSVGSTLATKLASSPVKATYTEEKYRLPVWLKEHTPLFRTRGRVGLWESWERYIERWTKFCAWTNGTFECIYPWSKPTACTGFFFYNDVQTGGRTWRIFGSIVGFPMFCVPRPHIFWSSVSPLQPTSGDRRHVFSFFLPEMHEGGWVWKINKERKYGMVTLLDMQRQDNPMVLRPMALV